MENISDQPKVITALTKAFMKASLEKNNEYMVAHLHEQFIFTTPRGVLLDKQSFSTNFVLNEGVRLELFELSEEKVFIVNSTAVLNGIIQIRFKGAEDQFERMTVTFVHDNNEWLMLAMQGTFIDK